MSTTALGPMARDREEMLVPNGGGEWRMAWHPPGAAPPGTPHGANAFCVTGDGDVVLISPDGSRWGWPGGRPERGESWEDTLRREMLEEACAEVTSARLLGFVRSRCTGGAERGLVLVRSIWCAEVSLRPWRPEFEIPFRRVIPARDLALHLWMEDGSAPVYSRAAREAALAQLMGAGGLNPEPVLVRHRIHDGPVPARRWGAVLFSDEVYHRHAGPRRYFWLLGEDVQLVYEPFGWRGEWYVDLVSVSESGSGGTACYTVSDELVDIVIEGMGPGYRIIDLDEAGGALAGGQVTAARLAGTLASAQRFLDRYLHRGARFPPPQIAPLFAPDHQYPLWNGGPGGARGPGSVR